MSDGAQYRYRAFISYSHRDAAEAQWLHRALERYRVPSAVRSEYPQRPGASWRVAPVFMDRAELASARDLSQPLREALDGSQALIVIGSPGAVASRWVNEEIAWFRRRHPQRPVFCVVVAGDPSVDPRVAPAQAAFPLMLALADPDRPDGALSEPIAADARPQADGRRMALLKLLAGLLDVRFDALRRREDQRRLQVLGVVTAASLVLTAVFAGLAVVAMQARDQAREAQAQAELELRSEQQTREFLLSVFALADPNESRGNAVTVREVLDNAANRIALTPFARPALKSRYLVTIGQAYASLGLNRPSLALLDQAISIMPDALQGEDARQRAQALLARAIVLLDTGDYAKVRVDADAMGALLPHATTTDDVLHPRLAILRGDLAAAIGDVDAARQAFDAAVAWAEHGRDRETAARIRTEAWIGLAFVDFQVQDHAAAESWFAKALAESESVLGASHPLTVVARSSRASNAYQSGDVETARGNWTEARRVALQLYAADNPVVGSLENNLGLLLMEAGELAEAERMLRNALASDRKHRSSDFPDLAYPLHNLGLLRLVAGDLVEATRLIDEGVAVAKRSGHPMLPALLHAQADLACMQGEASRGLALLESASALDGSHTPWLALQMPMTRWTCRSSAGVAVDRDQMRLALLAIQQRWSGRGVYWLRARQQADRMSVR